MVDAKTPIATGTGVDVLLDEKIQFTDSITTSARSWTELPCYTRTFITSRNYPLCCIMISIPFVANDTDTARNRLLLLLDDEPIYETTTGQWVKWIFFPLDINAHKVNLAAGTHKFKLVAATDKGTLNIPHYNPGGIEGCMTPTIFASILVFCYK